jgi:hypothetical protein
MSGRSALQMPPNATPAIEAMTKTEAIATLTV